MELLKIKALRSTRSLSVVCVVGVWDPPRMAHLALYRDLVRHAHRAGMHALVISLQPAPIAFSVGPENWATYSDISFRQHLQMESGVQNLGIIRLREVDAEFAGARELISTICSVFRVGELWVGQSQSFGRFERGSQSAILKACLSRSIECTILPRAPSFPLKGEAEKRLRAGQVELATRCAGFPPVWKRPPNRQPLELGWKEGLYGVRPYCIKSLSAHSGPTLPFQLEDSMGVQGGIRRTSIAVGSWPAADVEWIAFESGPGDAKDNQ